MALIAVLNLIVLWPIIDWYLSFIQTFFRGQEPGVPDLEALKAEIPYLLTWAVPLVFLSLAMIVLMTRAAIGGTAIAFQGGFLALVKRTLWTFWRYLCGIGWMLVIIIPISFVLGLVVGMSGYDPAQGAGISPFSILLVIVIYGVIIFLAMAVAVLMMVSFNGEGRDFRLPIRKSFLAMRGNLLRAVGVSLLLMIGFYMVVGLIGAILFAVPISGSLILKGLGLFILFAMGTVLNFILVAYGAIYANKLVPELRV